MEDYLFGQLHLNKRLLQAAKNGSVYSVRRLLAQGAHPGYMYHSAINAAVMYDHVEVAKELIKSGKTSIRNTNEIALYGAADLGSIKGIKFLVEEHRKSGCPYDGWDIFFASTRALAHGHLYTALAVWFI